jgi:hypothetical protein
MGSESTLPLYRWLSGAFNCGVAATLRPPAGGIPANLQFATGATVMLRTTFLKSADILRIFQKQVVSDVHAGISKDTYNNVPTGMLIGGVCRR